MLLGEVPVALESVENALELDQSSSDAWLLHARLLAAGEDQTSEAIQSVRRAVALGEYGILGVYNRRYLSLYLGDTARLRQQGATVNEQHIDVFCTRYTLKLDGAS